MVEESIASLVEAVKTAQLKYEDAKFAEECARSRATEALNNLNAAQKALDAAFDELRDEADNASGWKRDKRTGLKAVS